MSGFDQARQRNRRRAACCVGLLLASSLAAVVADTAPDSVRRTQVEAAFVFNFAKFIEWPVEPLPESTDAFRVGVLAHPEFGRVLERTVRGKTAQGRPIRVLYFDAVDEIEPCHVLVIGLQDPNQIRDALARVATLPVLTVSEQEGFTRQGGIVRFLLKDNRVRFRINADAAGRAGLEISSHLLRLAETVGDDGQGVRR